MHSTMDASPTAREGLRLSVLMAAGLFPEPFRTPIAPRMQLAAEGPGYRVSRVAFESQPGLWVTGNLWEPAPEAGGAHVRTQLRPAVLCPHGHWEDGRLARNDAGDIPARCAGLARLGYYVFSWDMVGYVDSHQLPHDFGTAELTEWGITPLGLQLWNSIRALDLVLSLPGVDPSRIGCTGESGGATQTFLLCAVDDRVTCSAPVNMISQHYHGGCVCENAPGLRFGADNVDIAGLFAPKPMLMVSATGDWTANTPTTEFPRMRAKYEAAGAPGHVAWMQVDAPHNYNRASREAVYAWFAHWFGLGPGAWAPLAQANELQQARSLMDARGRFLATVPEHPLDCDLGANSSALRAEGLVPPDALTNGELLRTLLSARHAAARRRCEPCGAASLPRGLLSRMCGLPLDWASHILPIAEADPGAGTPSAGADPSIRTLIFVLDEAEPAGADHCQGGEVVSLAGVVQGEPPADWEPGLTKFRDTFAPTLHANQASFVAARLLAAAGSHSCRFAAPQRTEAGCSLRAAPCFEGSACGCPSPAGPSLPTQAPGGPAPWLTAIGRGKAGPVVALGAALAREALAAAGCRVQLHVEAAFAGWPGLGCAPDTEAAMAAAAYMMAHCHVPGLLSIGGLDAPAVREGTRA